MPTPMTDENTIALSRITRLRVKLDATGSGLGRDDIKKCLHGIAQLASVRLAKGELLVFNLVLSELVNTERIGDIIANRLIGCNGITQLGVRIN